MFLQPKPNEGGAYPAPQSHYAPGLFYISDELTAQLIEAKGFVRITRTAPVTLSVKGQPVETQEIVSIEIDEAGLAAWNAAHPEEVVEE